MTFFKDRHDAGKQLAKKLEGYIKRPSLILALPRGGVPVGYEVAVALNLPLDVFIVRKLGVPGQQELAMGAIASGGTSVINEDVIRMTNTTKIELEQVIAKEQSELERREALYRNGRDPSELEDRAVILIDDGLATGASMMAAVQAVRAKRPAELIVAVPVSSYSTCWSLGKSVDYLVCLQTPENFSSVGLWYEDFSQTADQEVIELLAEAFKRTSAA